jgi:hypothetical protein
VLLFDGAQSVNRIDTKAVEIASRMVTSGVHLAAFAHGTVNLDTLWKLVSSPKAIFGRGNAPLDALAYLDSSLATICEQASRLR